VRPVAVVPNEEVRREAVELPMGGDEAEEPRYARDVGARERFVVGSAAAIVLCGCPNPGGAEADAAVDAGAPPRSVDILVMVDNSNSMASAQSCFQQYSMVSVSELLAPPDQDGDGAPDHEAVADIHVGVISSDMGTRGHEVQTCRDPVDGDDGVLLHEPADDYIAGCADSYPTYLSAAGGEDPSAVAGDLGCIATLGTGGCGFEQQLAAVREALTVHAADANAGFLRDDSLLVVVILTDEEDCSVRDDASADVIFDTQAELGPLNLRCFNHRDEYVEPVETYTDALLALRPGAPERVAVAVIAGIPPGTRHTCNLGDMRNDDFQCLLDLPEMQERVDDSPEGRGERLAPSCDEAGLGEAFPPRRLVTLAREVHAAGGGATVASICEADFRPAMERIASMIWRQLDR
jgi:hypothetical protein